MCAGPSALGPVSGHPPGTLADNDKSECWQIAPLDPLLRNAYAIVDLLEDFLLESKPAHSVGRNKPQCSAKRFALRLASVRDTALGQPHSDRAWPARVAPKRGVNGLSWRRSRQECIA